MKSLVLVVPLLALGQVGPPTVDWLEPGGAMTWDHDGLDVNGNPETLSHFVISVTAPTVADLTAPGTVILRSVTLPNGVALKEWRHDPDLVGLDPGIYRFWVHAVDSAGNPSAPSVPLSEGWDRVVPTAPAWTP